jgi:hypothetical protein
MYQLPVVTNEVTKSQIKIIAEQTISGILEHGNIIEMADTFAKVELLLKEIKSSPNYIDYLRDEVSKYGKSHTTSSGTKIELAEVGTKYDYQTCGDFKLEELMNQMAILETAIKERQAFLKTIPLSGMDVLIEGGEVCKIYPPIKTSTSSVKCTIAK